MSTFSRSLLLAGLAGWSCSLMAQPASVDSIEVIGRRVNLVGSSISASEGRIGHDELQERPLLRTGEVLEAVPGMVATQHSGSGKANQYFLRGFNLDHGTDFATSIDGMPINMRSHGHGQGYTDLNFIIPELLEEIIYRKGSYYADVGDFSGAGAARMTTLDHSQEPRVSLAFGEYDFTRLLASGGLDSLGGDLVFGVELQGYAGPWDSVDEDIDKTNLWLKQSWESGDDRFALMFMGYDNSWNSADQIPDRAVKSGMISSLGSIDSTVGGKSSRYSLSLNWLRNSGDSNWSGTAYAIDYDMNLWSNFSYFTQPQGDQFQQLDKRLISGGELQWQKTSYLSGREMTNSVGAQLRRDDIDKVGLRSTAARKFLSDIRLDRVDELSASLYWENQLHLTDRLRSVFGLRYDYYDFDVKALAAADPTTLIPNSGNTDDDIVTTSLSLAYALNDNNEVYAGIGQGFHSNDARGTTIAVDPVSGEAVLPVDPLVDTLGGEIGYRTFINDRLNATIALWQLEIDSELLFVGDAGNTEDTGVASTRRGVEISAYYQLDEAWKLDFEYSHTNARFDEPLDGSRLIAGALEDVFSGGINFQPTDRFSAYLRFRHFGEFPVDGGTTADGSSMVNLRLGYQVTANLQLSLDALNLLNSDDHDVEYFYESQLPGESGPVEDYHYHVFEPRSFRLYLNYQF
ncbi:MAG: TonB-dependent receptor [Pseudomonadales bacterium]|nr:TonB-dependent receptor [Pseudomonadales bacterium]